MNDTNQITVKRKKSRKWTIFFGVYCLLMSLFLSSLVFQLWPANGPKDDKGISNFSRTSCVFGLKISLEDEQRIIILVLLIGALGSYIHATTSFVTYVGNQKIVDSWIWWYILRPFIGMCLALIFYFVIRGGFLSMSSSAESLNLYGLSAIAGLVGMFSKQATDKLQELFDNLFKTAKGQGDDLRKDKLIDSISVRERMIPINKISFYQVPDGKSDSDIKIIDLYNLFKGIVTRLPVLNANGSARYIIHQSVLYKYIASKTFSTEDSEENPNVDEVKNLTLEDMVSFPGIKEKIKDSLVFVHLDETVGEVKILMEKTENCQDVFVTESGIADEPIKGWLTNIEISKSEDLTKA